MEDDLIDRQAMICALLTLILIDQPEHIKALSADGLAKLDAWLTSAHLTVLRERRRREASGEHTTYSSAMTRRKAFLNSFRIEYRPVDS
jgi:hypothetical protein